MNLILRRASSEREISAKPAMQKDRRNDFKSNDKLKFTVIPHSVRKDTKNK